MQPILCQRQSFRRFCVPASEVEKRIFARVWQLLSDFTFVIELVQCQVHEILLMFREQCRSTRVAKLLFSKLHSVLLPISLESSLPFAENVDFRIHTKIRMMAGIEVRTKNGNCFWSEVAPSC